MTKSALVLISEPKVTPENFAIDDESLNATSAIFTWSGVAEGPDTMQGHLIGYDVRVQEQGVSPVTLATPPPLQEKIASVLGY